MRRIRVSYSQIQRLQRCPQAWHMRYRRGLVPLTRKRPIPPWGDAYHAAAAAVWHERATAERSGWTGSPDLQFTDAALKAARAKLESMSIPGLDVEPLAQECAQAAAEACRHVGPEWTVLWLDGSPVVEREFVVEVGS